MLIIANIKNGIISCFLLVFKSCIKTTSMGKKIVIPTTMREFPLPHTAIPKESPAIIAFFNFCGSSAYIKVLKSAICRAAKNIESRPRTGIDV